MLTKAKAMKAARSLAKKLGRGWKPRVWANSGWHYQVVSPCGRLVVFPGHQDWHQDWHVLLGDRGSGTGRYKAHARTFRVAIRRVIEIARADLAAIGADFTEDFDQGGGGCLRC